MLSDERQRSFLVAGTQVPARPLEPALYLVATPIGNLGDITLRALETLAACDMLACEDTRVTRVLLDRYGISRRPIAYHEHNAAEAGPHLVDSVREGKSVALVSDAGTPLVSDPGFRLVASMREAGLRVVPIPGASAVLAALTASGLPSDAFLFAGFLPVKTGQRAARLNELKTVPATLIFFESAKRIAVSLRAMVDVLGERQAVVARELTKAFEETRAAPLADLAAHYEAAGAPKGEIVICVAPPNDEPAFDKQETDRLLLSLVADMPASKAAAEAARMTAQPKSDLYRRLVALKARGDAP